MSMNLIITTISAVFHDFLASTVVENVNLFQKWFAFRSEQFNKKLRKL